MVNSNTDALGILFPNSYDSVVPELVSERLMASIPFASRYRVVDFLLSGMVNSGIDNISLIVRKNYHSLMDHLGSGREWDLARKKGGLNLVPPFAEKLVSVYNGRVEALASILTFLKEQKEKYVVMADTNIVANIDFNKLLEAHIASGADVTIAYRKEELAALMPAEAEDMKAMYYTFNMEGNRIREMRINSREAGIQNVSMNVYVTSRELLIQTIGEAYAKGHTYFERDLLAPYLDKFNVYGYEYDGYVARISSMVSYFKENMKMLDEKNVEALFSPNKVYTKIRDDNPTRYIGGSKVKNVMAADGCVIEGEVENSILFRGVKIAKGAKVSNCVLMQGTVIEENASVEYVITDKSVTITAGKELRGTDTFPVYVEKAKRV